MDNLSLLKWPNLEHLEILNPLVSIILSSLSPITYISHHERDITLTLYFCVVLIPFLTTSHYHEVDALALDRRVYWPLSPTHRPYDNAPYIYLRENMYSSSSKQRPLISLIKRNLLHLSNQQDLISLWLMILLDNWLSIYLRDISSPPKNPDILTCEY